MARNNLCPDDYVKFIKKYINKKQGYTKNDIYEFCVANTEFMDEGDDEEIKHIIDISIDQFGRRLKKIGEIYFTVSSVEDIVVEDYPNIKISEENLKHIMSIEGKNMNFDLSNESVDKSIENQNLEKSYPPLRVTDETIENIKKYPRFYQNAPVRTYLGKIYKDGEFEEKSDRILSTSLLGDDQEHNKTQEGRVKRFIRKIGQKFKK